MRRLTRRARWRLLPAILLAGCAAPGLPPGGPHDTAPPVLLKVTPDSGSLRIRPREVVFRFDEVLSERPRSAPTIGQLVVVSPSEGPVNVDWRRQAVAIRPRKGWRANTAYTVTILPGLSDLSNNAITKPLHTVFSTGSVIPRDAVRGVAFDWVAQRVASGARIEATMGTDTLLRYLAAADSAGRFDLSGIPAGDVHVRAYLDANGNRELDRRESWDSVTIALADSARHDFYLFVHDSAGPHVETVTAIDSVTLRVHFNPPLSPASRPDTSNFVLRRLKDSTVVGIRRVLAAAAWDSLAAAMRKKAREDSVAKADSSVAGRRARARADSLRLAQQRDSIARAQIDSLRAARDTVKREPMPKPARAAPPTDFVLELSSPLAPGTIARLAAHGLAGLTGVVRSSQREVTVPKAPPKDSSAADGARTGRPKPPVLKLPAADSARTKRRAADSTRAVKKPDDD